MLFDAIIGQDKALNLISAHLKEETLRGAYLFCGPDGVGKTTAAVALAKSINCENSPYGRPCLECASCNKIEKGFHPDVSIIVKGVSDSQIKIESIRDMMRKVSLRPFEGEWKVFIVKDAEYLSEEAANALLKTLEEPPDNTVIILVSSNSGLMLPTVLSRCKRVSFSSLSPEAVKEILCNSYGMDEGSASFLSLFSEGSLGYALRFKDLDVISYKNSVIDSFLFAKYQEKGFDLFGDERLDLEFAIKVLTSCLRDIWLLKIGSRLILINNDRRNDFVSLKDKYAFEELDSLFKELGQLYSYAEKNINKKLLTSYLELRVGRKG